MLKTYIVPFLFLVLIVSLPRTGFAQLYYDTNGTTPGTNTSSTQNFTDAVWTTDSTGSSATVGYISGSNVIFSATDGVNVGTGTQSLTISNAESVGSFTINNGTLTLLGSGSPALTIGAGGITVNSNDGATTFSSSLGTITLGASQQWNNDSTQALTVGSAIAGGNNTLTFDGTGTGAVNLNGVVSNANIVQDSAKDTLFLTAGNSIKSTTIGDGGTIMATAANSVGGTITFNNGGGTLTFTAGTGSFSNAVVETAPTSGTDAGAALNFLGDVTLNGGTNTYKASLLTLGSGDDLDVTSGTQSISTLDLVGNGAVGTGHRLIVGISGQGFGFINGSTINVENGYTLDFGSAGTEADTINVASGTAIETRSSGVLNLTNTFLPTAGSVTIGSDDVGHGTLNITQGTVLSGDLTIHLQSANATSVSLGSISGSGNLNITGARQVNASGPSVLFLSGTDTYSGATTLESYVSPPAQTSDYAPDVDITGNSSGVGTAFNIGYGTLTIGKGGSISTNAIITLGNSASLQDFFQIGDGSGSNSVTVAGIYSTNPNGAADKIVGGSTATSNLTVDVPTSTTDIYYGDIANGGNQINFNNSNANNLSLTVGGPGTLILVRGDSSFSGGVFINGPGSLEAANDAAIGGDSNTVTLTNGGTLYLGTTVPIYTNTTNTSGGTFGHAVVLGTGGGDIGGTGDYTMNGTITGGTGLTMSGGDFLANNGSSTNNPGTITITSGRLLLFNAGLISQSPAVTVVAGTYDLGMNTGAYSTAQQITLDAGTALEARNNTQLTLSNVIFPANGTVTLGSDDVGGGTIAISSNIDLTNALAINLNGAGSGTNITLGGVISGSGSFTVNETGNGKTLLTLSGNNNYSGPTTLNNVTVTAATNSFGTSVVSLNGATVNLTGTDSSSFVGASGTSILNLPGGTLTGSINVDTGATLYLGNSGTLGSTVTLADGSALENNGGTVVLGNLDLPTTGTVTLGTGKTGGGSMTFTGAIDLTGPLALDVNGNGTSTTTVDLAGALSGSGALTVNPGPTGNSLLEFSGNSNYTGPTTLNSVSAEIVGNGLGSSAITSTSSKIYVSGGTIANAITAAVGQTTVYANGGDTTLTGQLEEPSNGGYFYFDNISTTGNLSVGSIDIAATVASRAAYFDEAAGAGSITLNGTYTSFGSNQSNAAVAGGSSLVFGDNGNGAASYYLGPTANFSQFETNGFWGGQATITLDAGTLYVDNSTFSSGQLFGTSGYAGTNHTIALVGSQQVNAQIYFDEKHGPALTGSFTLEQSTTDTSAWNGTITMDSTQLVVSAVDGGRLVINGEITGGSPIPLVKTGAGTVVFANVSGNNYGLGAAGDSVDAGAPPPTVAMDIQQGTLLVTNSSNSAFGNNSGTVNVEAGATLGGTGVVSQQVVAMDATSHIAVGDPGQANLGIGPKIGNLKLSNLTTSTQQVTDPITLQTTTVNSGLTLDFKLSGDDVDPNLGPTPGTSNDLLTVTTLAINGPVTVNLTALDVLATGVVYTLMDGPFGTWTGSDPSFTFNTPAGYILDPTYGDGGYYFNDGGSDVQFDPNNPGPEDPDTLTIRLIAAPEPSTYCLMLFSAGALAWLVRRRRLA